MAFDFPASPTTGQTFTPAGGPTYTWNGYAWGVQSSAVGGGLVLLNTLTASNSANLADTTSFTSAYDSYEIELLNVVPVTNDVQLRLELYGGGAFLASGLTSIVQGSYATGTAGVGTGGEVYSGVGYFGISSTSNQIFGVSSTAGIGLSGKLMLHGTNSTVQKMMSGNVVYRQSGASTITSGTIGGFCNYTAGAITGIRLSFSSGNISTGTIRIYGRKTS